MIIALLITAYALSVLAWVATWGHIAGRRGRKTFAERKEGRSGLLTPMNLEEKIAGWGIVWPAVVVAGVGAGILWVGVHAIELVISLFETSQTTALKVNERKKLAQETRTEVLPTSTRKAVTR